MSTESNAIDLSKAKTSLPIIQEGRAPRVRFANAKKSHVENKGDVFAFELHTLETEPDTEGVPIKPGFPIFDRVYLYGKDTAPGQIPAMAITKICKIVDAFLGTGDEGNKKNKPIRPSINPFTDEGFAEMVALLVGKEAVVKVKVKTGEYEGNEVSSYLNPADFKP